MTVDAYLAALERALPRAARRRALCEAREHLRDAAARHRAQGASDFEAEAAATRDFGPVAEVARRLSAELAIRETRLAAVLVLGAVAFFVFPLYVVPENTLPPPTWAAVPDDIHAFQRLAIGLWLAAGALAAASAVLAWTRWSRLSALALLGATLGIAGSIAASTVVVVRWFEATSATPNFALAAPFAAASLTCCLAAAGWARSSRRRLSLAD
jgi:hypothetical protein